jgi:hypothetical protein
MLAFLPLPLFAMLPVVPASAHGLATSANARSTEPKGVALSVHPPGLPAVTSPRCGTAAALLKEGKPREAAVLVDTVRVETHDTSACSDVADAVEDRFATVDELLDEATDAAGALPKQATTPETAEGWTSVRDDAKQALTLDVENDRASDLKRRADDALTTSTIEDSLRARGAEWLDAADESGTEVSALLGVAAATLTLTLLAARLLLLVPPSRRPRGNGRPRNTPARWARHPGVAALANLVAVIAVSWFGTPGLTARLDDVGVEDAGILAALVGTLLAAVFFTWGWLYHRLRVRIDMQEKGTAAKAGAAAIVTHLRDLGAAPPRGVEAPLGTDAETLTGSNITSTVKGVLSTLVGLLQTALAITPWRVLVDTVSLPAPSARTASDEAAGSSGETEPEAGVDKGDTIDVTVVMVSHHGRVVDSATIGPWLGGPGSPRVDPYKMVAARTLMSILHAQDDYTGLGGARNWRSIGLQYEAMTGRHSNPERKALLAAAVELDPTNWASRMSYRLMVHFHSSDLDTLAGLANWLRSAAAQQAPGDEALRARMLFNSYATIQNYKFVQRTADPQPNRIATPPDSSRVREELRSAINAAALNPDFRRIISVAASALTRPAPAAPQIAPLPANYKPAEPAGELGREVTAEEWLLMDPTMAYAWACWNAVEASRTAPPDSDQANDRAIRFLEFADGDSDVARQVEGDQTLEILRKTPAFRAKFGASPRTDLFSIDPFKTHQTALTAAALTEAADLADFGAGRLRKLIDVNRAVAALLIQHAALVAKIAELVPTHAIDITEVLRVCGVRSVDDLAVFIQDQRRATSGRDAIQAHCVEKSLPDPDPSAVSSLLGLG